jgi:hypothetical protein
VQQSDPLQSGTTIQVCIEAYGIGTVPNSGSAPTSFPPIPVFGRTRLRASFRAPCFSKSYEKGSSFPERADHRSTSRRLRSTEFPCASPIGDRLFFFSFFFHLYQQRSNRVQGPAYSEMTFQMPLIQMSTASPARAGAKSHTKTSTTEHDGVIHRANQAFLMKLLQLSSQISHKLGKPR